MRHTDLPDTLRSFGAALLLCAAAVVPIGGALAAQDRSSPMEMPASVVEAVSGKVAIVTGSSSGLGRELAEVGAELGMRLVLADIDLGPSAELAAEIQAAGGTAIAVEVDLADPAQRSRVVEAAVERFGGVDVLFNNAGYAYATTLEMHDMEAAHRNFEVNYWAYVDLAQRVVPHMRERGGGTIVNVASILGHRAAPAGWGVYAATKHALVGMFEAAAVELAPYDIRVRIASPGGMRTNILRNAVGPLADRSRTGADNWESPRVAARDIFVMMLEDDVVFYPGEVGRR